MQNEENIKSINGHYHITQCPQINFADLNNNQNRLIVDIRSLIEYQKGSIAGAVHYPLFNNQQRKAIGVIYKQVNKQEAIMHGYHIIENKLGEIMAFLKQFQGKQLFFLCARGGMRSKAMTNFAKENGFEAYQIAGGYKSYRRYILAYFDQLQFTSLRVVYGKTGTAKTRLLQKTSEAIDLESLAGHRGSIFGAIGKSPKTQQWFESVLFERLSQLNCNKNIYIEGESRKIGDLIIPNKLFQAMQKSPNKILVDLPLQERIAIIEQEYGNTQLKMSLSVLKNSLQLIQKFCSKQVVEFLVSAIEKRDFSKIIHLLLVHYYDPKYQKKLIRYHFPKTLKANNLDNLKKKWQELLKEQAKHED